MKENMLKQIIIDTIKGEEHLGENLKNQCVDYIEKLQNNWNELKNWCKENQYNDNFDSYQVDNYTTYGVILKKMEELQGDDKN